MIRRSLSAKKRKRIICRTKLTPRFEQLEQRVALSADGLEPNDSPLDPADLGTGDQARVGLSIHEPGNADWYRWTASASGSLSVEIGFTHQAGDLDLSLYGSNRSRLATSDSTNSIERITRQVTAGESFLIQVVGFGGSTNNYSLTIDGPGTAANPNPPPNTGGGSGGGSGSNGANSSGAAPIAIPSRTDAALEANDEKDRYRFSAVQGTEYEFETRLQTLHDSRLFLFDVDGVTQLSEDDDGGEGFASKIRWTAPASGIYLIEARAFSSVQLGSYTLIARTDGPSSPAPSSETLTVQIVSDSLSENGAATSALVSRSGSTSSPVTVQLVSSDTTEATVPSSIVIPAGSSSASFSVTPVDDVLADGSQDVTITATAQGFGGASDSVQILDSESTDDHGNSAASATLISAPSNTSGSLGPNDVDWFRIDAIAAVDYVFETSAGTLDDTTLTLFASDGSTQLRFDDDSGPGFASRITWSPSQNGTNYLQVASFDGSAGTYGLRVSADGVVGPDETLSFGSVSTRLGEGENRVVTISRTGSIANSVNVNLVSSDTSEATVPSSIVIPAGSAAATFTVRGVDDSVADGIQTATISASASSYASTTLNIQVVDQDTSGDDHGNAAISASSISVPSETFGRVETNGDADWFQFNAVANATYRLTTNLTSLSDSTLTLYDTDGTTQLAFNDDHGGSLASEITWEAPASGTYFVRVGAFSSETGEYSLSVTSDQPNVPSPNNSLSLEIARSSIQENGGTSDATIIRSGSTSGRLNVTLSSSDTTEASVPSTVVIPSGSDRVSFRIRGVDDTAVDGTRTVTITASASGSGSTAGTIRVLDNDATPTTPTPSTGLRYVSVLSTSVLGGVTVEDEDIVSYDGSVFRMVFDGSDVGIDRERIDAFDVLNDGSILMSFVNATTLPGIAGSVDDSDIVRFVSTRLGGNTAGSFELYFDGSDVGLTLSGEDVKGIKLLDDGRLLITTNFGVSVPRVSAGNEDILAFQPTSLGSRTSGTWSLYLDGSDIGIGSSDLDAFSIDSSGLVYFSLTTDRTINNVRYQDDDVLVFVPTSTGPTTAGSILSEVAFDGGQHGIADTDVFGFDID